MWSRLTCADRLQGRCCGKGLSFLKQTRQAGALKTTNSACSALATVIVENLWRMPSYLTPAATSPGRTSNKTHLNILNLPVHWNQNSMAEIDPPKHYPRGRMWWCKKKKTASAPKHKSTNSPFQLVPGRNIQSTRTTHPMKKMWPVAPVARGLWASWRHNSFPIAFSE